MSASASGRARVALIGAAVGEGASDPGCKAGPDALRAGGLAQRLTADGCSTRWSTIVRAVPRAGASRLQTVGSFARALAEEVTRVIDRAQLPIVLGGDHSCGVGTWSAVAEAYRPQGALGLVWVDAHLDAHTPHTSETGAPHGMPIAALLGHGDRLLTQVAGPGAKLHPENLVIIGARSFEPAEAALLARLGVRVIRMEEVRARGFAPCLAEGLQRVARRTAVQGLSLDLDALDPLDAPGTGCRVEGGLRLDEVVRALRDVVASQRLAAFELVEYDPHHDRDGITARAVERLLGSALGTREGLALAA